ncbi:hypothetical protein HDU67_008275 [Dinochytrium kinnereticum]|nr:hypothetical protein HDU67_008275 [Dinochytrium kinnereticum]
MNQRPAADQIEKDEIAVKAVSIENGMETCTVGFLPKFLLGYRDLYVNKFAQVVELYEDDGNRSKREYGYRNGGVARCAVCYITVLKEYMVKSIENCLSVHK